LNLVNVVIKEYINAMETLPIELQAIIFTYDYETFMAAITAFKSASSEYVQAFAKA
jgi:hypothetical protein